MHKGRITEGEDTDETKRRVLDTPCRQMQMQIQTQTHLFRTTAPSFDTHDGCLPQPVPVNNNNNNNNNNKSIKVTGGFEQLIQEQMPFADQGHDMARCTRWIFWCTLDAIIRMDPSVLCPSLPGCYNCNCNCNCNCKT